MSHSHYRGSDREKQPVVTLEIAMAYRHAGLPVVPFEFTVDGGKCSKRPSVPWKKYTQRLPTQEEMIKMFGSRADGIALVLGPASGCVIARDWDDGNLSYGAWKWTHPELAKTLPTAQTPRGFHIYARWPGVADAPKALYALDDGELRLRDCCVVLPPSVRPDGDYRWVGPPLDPATCPTIESPDGILCPQGTLGSQPSEARNATRQNAGGIQNGGSEKNESQPGGLCQGCDSSAQGCDSLCGTASRDAGDVHAAGRPYGWEPRDSPIERAVIRSIPSGHGQRNGCLFLLACRLRTVLGDGVAVTDPRVGEAFRQWWRRSCGKVATKGFETSWKEFISAWRRVKRIDPKCRLEEMWQKAGVDAATVSAYKVPWMRQLVRFCGLLQACRGGETFFLSGYDVADLAGVSQPTAWRGLKKLCSDGVIEMVKRGNRREANVYRFLGTRSYLRSAPA
jgi:hypothetical protein